MSKSNLPFRRRTVLKVGGGLLGTMLTPLTAAAEEGMHPIKGELPNENAPHETVHAFPAEDATREVGQFLELRNGWAFPDCTRDEQREFFDKTRQTFVYDGQTFVLDSFEDWEPYKIESDPFAQFAFTHTDPPKRKGKTFKVTWDTIYTADFDNPCVDGEYEEGDRQADFPFESSYEIVKKG